MVHGILVLLVFSEHSQPPGTPQGLYPYTRNLRKIDFRVRLFPPSFFSFFFWVGLCNWTCDAFFDSPTNDASLRLSTKTFFSFFFFFFLFFSFSLRHGFFSAWDGVTAWASSVIYNIDQKSINIKNLTSKTNSQGDVEWEADDLYGRKKKTLVERILRYELVEGK
jgi:hypothetical protein